MERKKVFLSSVFGDFGSGFSEERAHLVNYLSKYKNYFNSMVDLGDKHSDTETINTLKKSIDNVLASDIVIVFVGKNYGTLRQKSDVKEDQYKKYFEENEELSLTHLEYRAAISEGKQVLVVLSRSSKDKYVQNFIKEISDEKIYLDIDDIWKHFNNIRARKTTENIIDIDPNKKELYLSYLSTRIIEDLLFNLHNKNSFASNSECKNCRIYEDLDGDASHYIVVSDLQLEEDEVVQDSDKLREKMEDAEKNKEIYIFDQKLLYTSVQTVKHWSKQEEVRGESEDALDLLLKSNLWKEECKNIDTIIDLGVGVGIKTPKIVKSFFKNEKKINLNLILVDFSYNMVYSALKHINKMLKAYHTRYTLDSLVTDFLTFETSKKCFEGKKEKKTAYFLLGGTFGNINELEFIESISNVAVNKDLLIIGCFLYTDEEQLKKTIENNEHYDKTKVHDMFSPSLQDIDLKILSTRRNGLEIDIEIKDNISKIKNTKSLAYIVQLQDIDDVSEKYFDIQLIHTNRYIVNNVVDFIETESRFKHIESFIHNDGSFAYLVFEYNE